MIWTRSETLALARMQCVACRGFGLCATARGEEVPCDCVLRAIFKACYNRFKHAAMSERRVGIVHLNRSGAGNSSRASFGRKNEEYIADFTLICRRTLTSEEYRLFHPHYLLGADQNLVAKKLGISRNTLMHRYATLEAKLGRAFREVEPFSLFPVDGYFSDPQRGLPVRATSAREAA